MSSLKKDDVDNVKITKSDPKNKANWVQFEEESNIKMIPVTVDTPSTSTRESPRPETISTVMENDKENSSGDVAIKNNSGDYSGAVISTESVQINLDRSSLNHSIAMEDSNMSFSTKTNSLKTIDLRNSSNNGRTSSNPISNTTGFFRQGFVNGDTIVTLLPVNTRWPWITPARFKPELVPEELMAQGLTVIFYLYGSYNDVVLFLFCETLILGDH